MVPHEGRQPPIGWNNHLAGGWQVQLARVRRWYGRAATATDPIDRGDYLHAFFENAYHLRDWREDTGVVSRIGLQAFFDANEEMRLGRELGNSRKRYALKRPDQFVLPLEVHEYSGGIGNLSSDTSLLILSDGKKHDAFDLARRVIDLWEA